MRSSGLSATHFGTRANRGSADQVGIFLRKLLMDTARRLGLRILRGRPLGLLPPAKVIHAFVDQTPALSIFQLSPTAFE